MPDHLGNTLTNLIGELETRSTGTSPSAGLAPDLAAAIPDAETYVVVLFDGLGTAQLDHPKASSFQDAASGVLTSPFPTTTSVALSSVVTGSAPIDHGITSHLMWLPDLGKVVNTLKWLDVTGAPVAYDYASLLPRPNLWERLRGAGVEPITVQPGAFQGSPLSRMLYRGARFEPAWDELDLVDATVQLAEEAGRFIFTYVWQVDFAGHVHGLASPEFGDAMTIAATVWEGLATRLPPGVGLVGTADHGLIGYDEADKVIVRDPRFGDLVFSGDPRGVQVRGPQDLIAEFAETTGGTIASASDLYGGPTSDRVESAIVMAPQGKVILPPGFDKRLLCYHGGLEPSEVEVPLLVG